MPRDDEAVPPISPQTKRRDARAGMLVVAVAAVILLLTQGPSIRSSGESMEPGVIKTAVLAVGKPSGWLGDKLPFPDWAEDATAWLDTDDDLSDAPGGFAQTQNQTSGVAPVTEAAFPPAEIGLPAPAKRDLGTLVVTGDSMSAGLDAVLARELSGDVTVEREPHLGTGISRTDVVDWDKLANRQTSEFDPDAVVIIIGADDFYTMGGAECCGADWAAEYATRARLMMETYRQDGDTKVYWLSLPLARDADQRGYQKVINAAIRAAAAPYRRDVEILDMTTLFTPDGEFRDEMEVDGKDQLVRAADGVHWNDRGDDIAGDEVLRALAQDFESIPEP